MVIVLQEPSGGFNVIGVEYTKNVSNCRGWRPRHDGKKRPVLILDQTSDDVTVFNITTQYEGKSESVRNNYFKINDWSLAGLKKSHILTLTILLLCRFHQLTLIVRLEFLLKPI